MTPEFTIECLLTADNHLGEGPVWDVADQCLYWVDSTGRRVGKDAIWRLDPESGEVRSWSLDADVGAMALRKDGGAVLALSDGFYGFNFGTGETQLIAKVDDDPTRARLNDGKCDRRGRFFAGGMDDQEELGVCGLWRLDPDLSLTKVESGIICSNGPCWSPDDSTFYFADTFKNEIWAYDYDIDTGAVSNRRVFASTSDDAGFADGSTVDAEGYLWNAQVISGDLIRYAPDGQIDRKISMPVKNITSVIFGGPDLDEIYVTSMARVSHPASHDNFAVEAKPQFAAGGLFRIRGLGIRGIAEPRFAG
ncbi:SMP-30/gluconolactonase/LRE family protein [Roseobacter sp. A03A-229]